MKIRIAITRALVLNVPDNIYGKRSLPANRSAWESVVELIPDVKADWKSDIWDLNPYFSLLKGNRVKLSFKGFDAGIKDYIKAYVAYQIDERTKISTIKGRLASLKAIWTDISRETGYVSMFQVTTKDIIRYVDKKTRHAMSTGQTSITIIRNLINFLQEEHAIYLPIDIEAIEKKRRQFVDSRNMIKDRHRYADIPKPLYDAAIQMYYDVMKDPGKPFNTRMTAGMFLLASQTGLRMSDLTIFHKDPIRYLDTLDNGRLPWINYRCMKAGRGGVEAVDKANICTPLAQRTITYIQQLRKQHPAAEESEFLFCLLQDKRTKKISNPLDPVSSGRIGELHRMLFIRNLPQMASMEWSGITMVRSKSGADKGVRYSVPTVHNYRTHYASELNRQNCPLDYIECLLGHSFAERDLGGYCRENITTERRDAAWSMLDSPDIQTAIENIIYERTKHAGPDSHQ